MLEKRVQILLDPERYERISLEARRRGTSMGAVIRDAIDRLPAETDEGRQRAIRAILAAEPMEVPQDPRNLRRELDRARLRAGR